MLPALPAPAFRPSISDLSAAISASTAAGTADEVEPPELGEPRMPANCRSPPAISATRPPASPAVRADPRDGRGGGIIRDSGWAEFCGSSCALRPNASLSAGFGSSANALAGSGAASAGASLAAASAPDSASDSAASDAPMSSFRASGVCSEAAASPSAARRETSSGPSSMVTGSRSAFECRVLGVLTITASASDWEFREREGADHYHSDALRKGAGL